MRQYFMFLFRRAGAPLPSSVAILKRPQDWVNRHVLEEWQFSFPKIPVTMLVALDGKEADLLVLPFIDNFLVELPGTADLYKRLRRDRSGSWVMLYGLNHRRIDLVPAGQLFRYYQRRRRLIQIRRTLERFKMGRFVRFAIRQWNWRWR